LVDVITNTGYRHASIASDTLQTLTSTIEDGLPKRLIHEAHTFTIAHARPDKVADTRSKSRAGQVETLLRDPRLQSEG
jgi:hypothetical protein